MSELFKWFKTRVLTLPVLGLTLLPSVAAISATLAINGQPPPIFGTLLLGGLLVISFRLWDDLEDRDFDQIKAPGRVLVTAGWFVPFWCTFVAVLAIVAVMLMLLNGPERLVPFLILLVFMAVLYRSLPAMTSRRTSRDFLVLLKYPSFVYLLAPTGFGPTVVVAGLVVLVIVAAFDTIDQSKQMLQ